MVNREQKSILVIDSGVGGMTIVKAIRQQNTPVLIRYISDNKFFPYGSLSEDKLVARVRHLVGQAIDRFPVDAVVIACNTASTVVLEPLRAAYAVPFIGVVPPIRTASEISVSRVIGLLATEGTVKRTYTDTLIHTFAADCTVVKVHCPDLAPMAEEKARGYPTDRRRLRQAVASLFSPTLRDMDVVVLGCTHYPIMQRDLEAIFKPDTVWLNPAWPVARQLMRVLYGDHRQIVNGETPVSDVSDDFYVTSGNANCGDMDSFLRDFGLRSNNPDTVGLWVQ